MSEYSDSCKVWGTPAKYEPKMGDFLVVKSGRAGGTYVVTGSAEPLLAELSGHEKALLSYEILVSNVNGHIHNVSTEELAKNSKRRPPSIDERINLILKLAQQRAPRFSQTFALYWEELLILGMVEDDLDVTGEVGTAFYELMEDRNLVSRGSGGRKIVEGAGLALDFTLSAHGWEASNNIGGTNAKAEQIFVAMWFSPETEEFYQTSVEPAIRRAGYRALRIDAHEHNEMIDDQIVAEIRRSKALLCDLTTNVFEIGAGNDRKQIGAPRGGVYYEAGFAKGMGLPVIWSVKSDIADTRDVVHFDVRQYNQIRWRDDDLDTARDRIEARIISTLGVGPLL